MQKVVCLLLAIALASHVASAQFIGGLSSFGLGGGFGGGYGGYSLGGYGGGLGNMYGLGGLGRLGYYNVGYTSVMPVGIGYVPNPLFRGFGGGYY